MERFCGMMPPDCIEIEKRFKDQNGLRVTIEAGQEGWTLIWADCSVDYVDDNDTSENNFQKAYEMAVREAGPLIEI